MSKKKIIGDDWFAEFTNQLKSMLLREKNEKSYEEKIRIAD